MFAKTVWSVYICITKTNSMQNATTSSKLFKVTCKDASGMYAYLTEGKEYTVYISSAFRADHYVVYCNDGVARLFATNRFVVKQPTPPMTTKQTIKAIAAAVYSADNRAEYAQEMSDRVDYGEFAPAIAPDYSGIIARFGLTKDVLIEYGLFAKQQAETFRKSYPVRNFQPDYKNGIWCPLNKCEWHEGIHNALKALFETVSE